MANRFLDDPDAVRSDPDELTHEQAGKEIDELREAIERWNRAYYVEGLSPVSDETWDRHFRRLERIERRFPDLDDESSPTRRVGVDPVDQLENVEHVAAMLSLEAVLEDDAARAETERLLQAARERTGDARSGSERSDSGAAALVAEPKLDGLSLEVVYEGGVLVRAATRGDGRIGDDVTANARTVRSLPLRLAADAPDFVAVRGELLLRRDEFAAVNEARVERGDEPFANPRNAAAGTIRQFASRSVATVPLDFVAYDLLAGPRTATHKEELRLIASLGIPVPDHVKTVDDFESLVGFRKRLLDERDTLQVELDGVVVKANAVSLREEHGTRDRNPRWAFAWKFPPRRERTRVRRIAVSVGRTGKITPIGLLDPVSIGGVTVSRVSLHNQDEMHRLDVRRGDLIRVERAGDVIPHVVERIPERGRERSEPFRMPEVCPVCGTGIVRDGAYHRCPNGLACPAQLVGAIVHYGAREALDIDHLGERTAEQLVESGLVRRLDDLYRLEAGDVASLDGFAEKRSKALVEAIAASREPALDRFLYALGIPGIGRRLARVLAGELGTIGSVMDADEERLARIHEIGREGAASVVHFFGREATRSQVEALLDVGVTPQVAEQPARTLEGLRFVITGTLSGYTRAEARDEVERRGGRVTSSVSDETDYLVVGDNPGSKLDEAEARGVQTLDVEGFERLLSGERSSKP